MPYFATVFTKNEIRSQPVTQIPWNTIVEVMRLTSSKEETLWYVNQIKNNTTMIFLPSFKDNFSCRQNVDNLLNKDKRTDFVSIQFN